MELSFTVFKLASLRVLEPLLFNSDYTYFTKTLLHLTGSLRFCSRCARQVFDFISEEPRLSTRKNASLYSYPELTQETKSSQVLESRLRALR
jgi:hypothetical protein